MRFFVAMCLAGGLGAFVGSVVGGAFGPVLSTALIGIGALIGSARTR